MFMKTVYEVIYVRTFATNMFANYFNSLQMVYFTSLIFNGVRNTAFILFPIFDQSFYLNTRRLIYN